LVSVVNRFLYESYLQTLGRVYSKVKDKKIGIKNTQSEME